MSESYVGRFAEILLRNNEHLGTFEVNVMDREFALSLAEKLREMSCLATVEDHGALITVECPSTVQTGVSTDARLI